MKLILQKLNNRKGFTLIELMIIIAIIGILVAIFVPNLIKYRERTSNKDMEVITQTEEKALEEKESNPPEQEKVVKQKGDMNKL